MIYMVLSVIQTVAVNIQAMSLSKTLGKLGIIQSMNSAAGRCHDNAKCESMWGRGKCEIMACYDIKRMRCEEIKSVIFKYYMCYWNNRRICSAIGGVPPMIKRVLQNLPIDVKGEF